MIKSFEDWLLKLSGVKPVPLIKYNEDQPRDKNGRFGYGSSSSKTNNEKIKYARDKEDEHEKLRDKHLEEANKAYERGDETSRIANLQAAAEHGLATNKYGFSASRYTRSDKPSSTPSDAWADKVLVEADEHSAKAYSLSDKANKS